MGKKFESDLQIVETLNPFLLSNEGFWFGNIAFGIHGRLDFSLPSNIDILCPSSTHFALVEKIVQEILTYKHDFYDPDHTEVILDTTSSLSKLVTLHIRGFEQDRHSVYLPHGLTYPTHSPLSEKIKYSGMEVPVASFSLLTLLGTRPRVLQ